MEMEARSVGWSPVRFLNFPIRKQAINELPPVDRVVTSVFFEDWSFGGRAGKQAREILFFVWEGLSLYVCSA